MRPKLPLPVHRHKVDWRMGTNSRALTSEARGPCHRRFAGALCGFVRPSAITTEMGEVRPAQAPLRHKVRLLKLSTAKRANAFLRPDAVPAESKANMGAIIRLRERLRLPSGQTMTEYALILATVAAVLISLYTTSGTIIKALINQVDPML